MQKYENLVDLENPEKMSIWLQNRRRYSRERAPRSLGENSIQYSFVSLETSLSEGSRALVTQQLVAAGRILTSVKKET